jgi:SAM-dependent methyltransferase
MKNKEFFYQQYEKINWENQEKTKINSFVNDFILRGVITKINKPKIKIFDIGFGIGFFIKMAYQYLNKKYKEVVIEGCEPSEKNYNYFIKNNRDLSQIKSYKKTFLDTFTDNKFDVITSIYTFTAFVFEDLEPTAEKINEMLEKKGKFILVVANEGYLAGKLKSMKDLFIEKNMVEYNGKEYEEVLHYSDIPEIGKVIDYNREERFYIDLFTKKGFKLSLKRDLDDNGFICTVFVFEKERNI